MGGKAKRKICVITGGRAEYGLLAWVIRDLHDDPDITCQIIATGAHLVPEAGMTYRVIEADGFTIDRKLEIQLASDSGTGMAKSTGLATLSFADAYRDLAPDIVVVLGDRYEIVGASMAAYLMGIPVAHISGGEKTEGAVDDALRHIITKCSRFHFVAAEDYRRRVIQLGETPDSVFNVGDPGIDNIHRLPLFDRAETLQRLKLAPDARYLLVTYHPVTATEAESLSGMRALIEALDAHPDLSVVLTRPNLDAGAREIGALADEFAARRPDNVRISTSLGQLLYLSAMRHSAGVIGNSSSGIVEAPAMRVPTVDIGTRQKGRLKAGSIIECTPDREAITNAISRVLSAEFADIVGNATLEYGDKDASRQVAAFLKTVDLSGMGPKIFYDIEAP